MCGYFSCDCFRYLHSVTGQHGSGGQGGWQGPDEPNFKQLCGKVGCGQIRVESQGSDDAQFDLDFSGCMGRGEDHLLYRHAASMHRYPVTLRYRRGRARVIAK